MKNKKNLGINFNPGPSSPRPDGRRDANPNVISPFNNFDGLLSHIAAQRATVDQSADDADSEDAPAQKKKKTKASKPSATPTASTVKPLKTAPPKSSVQSEDLSRISKPSRVKMPLQPTSQELTDCCYSTQ